MVHDEVLRLPYVLRHVFVVSKGIFPEKYLLKIMVLAEALRLPSVLRPVVGVGKGRLPKKYFV